MLCSISPPAPPPQCGWPPWPHTIEQPRARVRRPQHQRESARAGRTEPVRARAVAEVTDIGSAFPNYPEDRERGRSPRRWTVSGATGPQPGRARWSTDGRSHEILHYMAEPSSRRPAPCFLSHTSRTARVPAGAVLRHRPRKSAISRAGDAIVRHGLLRSAPTSHPPRRLPAARGRSRRAQCWSPGSATARQVARAAQPVLHRTRVRSGE
jgi:hypothetical protein